MSEVPPEFCGYEWPADCERFNYNDDWAIVDAGHSHAQTTCIRGTLPDTNRCVWHALPGETEHKSVESLRDAQVHTGICIESKPDESLNGAVLAGVEVDSKLEFNETLLRGANLSGASLTDTDLSKASLIDADLSRAGLIDADLSKAHLHDANLSKAKLNDVDLSKAGLIDADLPKASLIDVDLSEANLSGADLSEAFFAGVEIWKTDLRGADFSEASLRGADFSEANLSSADFSEANLSSADFSEAGLRDANLSEANLIGTDFSEAGLCDANLSETGLRDANLSEANLSGADLSEAGLRDANLSEASLSGANLLEADLSKAILTGADLAGAKLSNLTVDRETTVDSLVEPEPSSPWSALPQSGESDEDEESTRPDEDTELNDWDRTARAYHSLKTEFHANGLVGKARRLHVDERRARRHETAAEVGWFSRQHLTQFVSGLFTGYGVGVWRLVTTMAALFTISTVTYALAGVTDPLTYSTITFATSPPKPTDTLPIWARFVASVETFLGTLLIVSLGFVLGNREQF